MSVRNDLRTVARHRRRARLLLWRLRARSQAVVAVISKNLDHRAIQVRRRRGRHARPRLRPGAWVSRECNVLRIRARRRLRLLMTTAAARQPLLRGVRRMRHALAARLIAVTSQVRDAQRDFAPWRPPTVPRGRAALFQGAGKPVVSPLPQSLARRATKIATAGVAGMLALLLMAWLVLPAAARSATRSLVFGIAPSEQAALSSLSQRSVVLASDGTVIAVLHDEIDRKVVPLESVPEHVRRAVLTAEDRKFWEHPGFDLEGIGRALMANFQAGGITQGGSTITQQIAKSVVGNEQSLERKLSELAYAVALEREYRKDELLERYLNQVYFGWGAYGIAAAAEQFFDQPDPSQLRVEQGALLAGLIRSPGALDPRRHPEAALARRNQVLTDMASTGYLDPRLAELLVQTPLGVVPPSSDAPLDPYLTAAVQQEFLANPVFGRDREARAELLFGGGLKIETSLDPRLQQIAREVVSDALPNQAGPTAAIASVDPRDGRILAIYGGTDFAQEQFNLATQGRRQPGSSFKPFVLATALQQGLPLRLELEGNSPLKITGIGSPEWAEEGVDNFGGADYGRVDLRTALVNSVNTAFAQLIVILGTPPVLDLAAAMGIDVPAATAGLENPSIALGGLARGVTPLEMASAYGTFANGGSHVAAALIDRVTQPDGTVLFQRTPQPRQVLDPHVNAAMVSVMQDVVRGGTGSRARLTGWLAAGKTGTTQRNADAWFVGYVPIMSTAVWMGHPDGQIPMRGNSSSSFSAGIWRAFMTRALEGIPPVPFPDIMPGERQVGLGTAAVPDVVGMNETDALRALAQAKLVGEAHHVPSRSRPGTVIGQRPSPASTAQIGDTIVISVAAEAEPDPEGAPGPGDGRGRAREDDVRDLIDDAISNVPDLVDALRGGGRGDRD